MFSPLSTLTRFPDVHALISTTTILKHYIRDYPDYAPITFQEVVIVMIKSSTGTLKEIAIPNPNGHLK